jgi:hypothetical protein
VEHVEADAELHSKRFLCCQALEVAMKPVNTRLKAALFRQMRASEEEMVGPKQVPVPSAHAAGIILRNIDFRGWRKYKPASCGTLQLRLRCQLIPKRSGIGDPPQSAASHDQISHGLRDASASGNVAARFAGFPVTARREP